MHPQPQVGFVALIEAPFWLTDQLYAPVLFEIHAVAVVRFCDYLVGRVTVEDLRVRVGDHWIPGGRFFVADAAEPVQEDAVVHVPPGSLIRLLPQDAPLPPRVSLQVKLRDPQRWFVPADYSHSPALQPGCIGLVGPLGEWTCIDASSNMEPRQLREAISDLCGASPSDIMATTPCEQPLSLSFRGARVVSLLSVMSRALAGGCIVFFDARDLGVPVSALCLPVVYTSVGSVIRLLGGSRPIGVPISVRGAADFDPGTETFLPVHRALVTVRVLSGDEAPLDAHAGQAPASSLPAALPGASSTSSSGWVADNGDNVSGACGRQFADDRMDRPSHPTPGTNAKHVWPAHLATLADRSCDVVHEAAGAPALGTTAGAGAFEVNDFHDDGSPDEGSESGARDGSSASTLNTWRLPLRLLYFQRPDTFCTIFVAEGERLSDIMTRACILLDPPGDPHDLFVPDPQPAAEWLTVLVVPAWWKSRGSNAVLISSADADEHDHLAVCSHGITIPDILPPADSAAARRVDVFNTGGFVADAADIVPGSMLFLQSVGAPLPTLPSVRQIVSDPSLDCRDDQLPQPAVPPPLRVLALGPDCRQVIIDLAYGRIAPQVATAIGSDPASLQIWVQKGPSGMFGDIAVCGRVVRKCAAFRFRVHLPDNHGLMIFVDARRVGKPICSFLSPMTLLRVEDVLEALELAMPRGFTAHFTGGHPVGGDAMVLRVENCGSLTVWFENPNPQVLPSTGEEDDGEAGPHDGASRPAHFHPGDSPEQAARSQHHSTQSPDTRSRSPRRGGRAGPGPRYACVDPLALLAVSNYPGMDIAFVGACQPALSCASGQCCTSEGVPQAAVRNSHLFQSSSSPGTLEYHHVKSHEGDFANEVVDVAARMAAHTLFLGEHRWPQLDFWLARGGACLSWASLVCRSLQGDVSLPDFAGPRRPYCPGSCETVSACPRTFA